MKPFNLELAKAGHPVCTRDGRDVRILCFDRIDELYPIIGLASGISGEDLRSYTLDGRYHRNEDSAADLMMKSIKKEGWINIYKRKTGMDIYKTEEEAFRHRSMTDYVDTIKIEWEE